MKIIYPNLVSVSSVSSELDGYPKENITNIHSKQRWKPAAADGAPTVNLDIIGAANCLCIYNIDADSVNVNIKDSGGTSVYSQNHTLSVTDTYGTHILSRVWIDYTEQPGAHTAVITLSGSGTAVGLIYAGICAASFNNPEYGINSQGADFGQEVELENGFRFVWQGNPQRSISGNLVIRDDAAQYAAFMRLAESVGILPFACLLHDSITPNHDYIIYGKFGKSGRPQGTKSKYNTDTISFTITEFL